MLLISVLTTIFMSIIKAYCWLLKQAFKIIWNVWKLVLALTPVTALVLAILILLEGAGFVTKEEYIPQHISDVLSVASEAAEGVALPVLTNGDTNASDLSSNSDSVENSSTSDRALNSDVSGYASSIAGNLTDSLSANLQDNIESGVNEISDKLSETVLQVVSGWWEGVVRSSEEKALRIIVIVVTILIGIPIFLALLAVSAVERGLEFLGLGLIADAVLYILRSIFSMSSPFQQFRKRYYLFFHKKPFYDPLYEDSYQNWLKRHHDEFENDTFGTDQEEFAAGAEYESRRSLSRAERAKLERIRKRQQKYDSYYEDDQDRLNYYEDDQDRLDYYEDEYDEPDGLEDEEYKGLEYDDDQDDSDGFIPYERISTCRNQASRRHSRRDSPNGFINNSKRNRSYYESDEADSTCDDTYEEYDSNDNESHNSNKQTSPPVYSNFDFFAGCSSRESVKKKYHSLVKLYHPDNQDGDSSALQEINRQCKEALKKISV